MRLCSCQSVFSAVSFLLLLLSVPASAEPSFKRTEQSILDLQSVSGYWLPSPHDVSVDGHVFSNAIGVNMREGKNKVVFSNREDYDLLEAWIGFRDDMEGTARARFAIKGDDKILYESGWISKGNSPLKISISIKGYSGITMGVKEWQYRDSLTTGAVFAEPKFVRIDHQDSAPPPSFKPPGVTSGSDSSWKASKGAAISVVLNGRPIAFSNALPTRIGGRIMVPMRDIFESLGATVRWNAGNQTIHASGEGTAIDMQIGNFAATVNGQQIDLDQPPVLHLMSTMVPLRFVSESLGGQVVWDEYRRTVTISRGPH